MARADGKDRVLGEGRRGPGGSQGWRSSAVRPPGRAMPWILPVRARGDAGSSGGGGRVAVRRCLEAHPLAHCNVTRVPDLCNGTSPSRRLVTLPRRGSWRVWRLQRARGWPLCPPSPPLVSSRPPAQALPASAGGGLTSVHNAHTPSGPARMGGISLMLGPGSSHAQRPRCKHLTSMGDLGRCLPTGPLPLMYMRRYSHSCIANRQPTQAVVRCLVSKAVDGSGLVPDHG